MHKKMRIAIVAASCPPIVHGGVSTAHFNLFLFLKNAGFEVRFFTYNDSQAHCDDDVNIIRFKVPRLLKILINFFWRCAWRAIGKSGQCIQLHENINSIIGGLVVRRRLFNYRPGLVILPDRGAVGLWIGKPRGSKILQISHHNPDRFRSPIVYGFAPSARDIEWALWMERRAMRYVDAAICPSRYMANCFSHTFGQRNVKIIPNIIDTSLICFEKKDIRSDLNLGSSVSIIYIPTPGIVTKGSRYILEIMNRIKECVCDVVFYLSGSISDVQHEEFKLSGLSKHIFAPGRTDYKETLALVSSCDICVSPSLTESFSMALCEAALLELPIVALDSGGVQDIICDGVTGYIVPMLDIATLAEKTVFLLRNKTLAQQFGKAAKAKITSDMDVAKSNFLDFISRISSL